MTTHVNFEVSAQSTADPDRIWELLAEGATWPTWSPIGRFALEKEGHEGHEGGESLGAIRSFKTGTVNSREELLELSPGKRLRYTAFAGLPLRNHEAAVELEPNGTGTTITWREDFDAASWRAWILKAFLRSFVQRCANGLATHAAR